MTLIGESVDPATIIPWGKEAAIVDGLHAKRGGEWVVAAAFLDYAHLTETTRALRSAFTRHNQPLDVNHARALLLADSIISREDGPLIEDVQQEALAMVFLIPRNQRLDVVREGEAFLSATAGHYAVDALVKALD